MSNVSEMEKEFERVEAEAMALSQRIIDLLEEDSSDDEIAQLAEELDEKEDELTRLGREIYGHAAVEMSK